MAILGIKFAPLFIPLERRLQTLAVLYFCNDFLFTGLVIYALLIYLLFTKYYWISLAYFVWLYCDRNTCRQGGRRVEWFRSRKIWRHFANYFPIKLIKTVDLPPDRNYIFGCHPHGLFCFSHFANFSTEGTGFSDLFPGIRVHLIALNFRFFQPLHREMFMLTGACSASADSIECIIGSKETGKAVAIVVGGAREVLDTIPGKMILTLNKRKGFIRLALKNGVSLVPVISFGENDLYKTMNKEEPTLYLKIQEKILRILTFPIPLFNGRGPFQYSFGFMPHRRPITTVVGKPIDVEKEPNPSQEQIDQLHRRYIDELAKLFEEHKAKYSYANVILKIK